MRWRSMWVKALTTTVMRSTSAGRETAHYKSRCAWETTAHLRSLVHNRLYTAEQSSTSVEKQVKDQMLKLYKRVHPDLFHAHPSAKEANEKGFKLLQQFISGSNSQLDKPAEMFHFTFFLKEGDASDLRKVEIALRQPRFLGSWNVEKSGINPALAPVLNRLLDACGLDTIKVSGSEEYDPEPTTDLLGNFLRYAVDMSYRNANKVDSEMQTMSSIQTALRMRRHIIVTNPKSLSEISTKDKIGCLSSLVKLLDKSKNIDINGIRIVLSTSFGVSSNGDLHVNPFLLKSTSDWEKYLTTNIDITEARSRAHFLKQIVNFESDLAKALGIAVVHTSSHIQNLNHRMDFLKSLMEEVRVKGPLAKEQYKSLKLLVGKEFDIQKPEGNLIVPISADNGSVYSFLKSNATEAYLLSSGHEQNIKELERLKRIVRSRLKIRTFAKDDRINIHQFRQCANRLVRLSSSLVSITEGAKLRVSNANRLPSIHSEMIDIAWDFAA